MYNLEVSCVSVTRGPFSCVHVGLCVCPVLACLRACVCVLSASCVGKTGWEIGFCGAPLRAVSKSPLAAKRK